VLVISLGAWVGGAPGQAPEQLLESVRERLSDVDAGSRVGEVEALVGELQTLHDAPAPVRERACRLLYGLMREGGVHDRRLRMRLAVLRAVAMLSEDPRWVDRLVELSLRGGDGSLSGVSFWVERALGAVRTVGHVERLASHAGGEDDDRRRVALGALARLEDVRLRPALAPMMEHLMVAARGEDAESRARALEVLGLTPSPGGLPALMSAARDPNPLIRLAAVRGLGRKLDLPGVVAYLCRSLADDVALVREEAVIALRQAPDRSAVPLLVRRMSGEPLRLRLSINETLHKLTGFDHGADGAAWSSWLKSVKAAGKLEEVKPGKSGYADPTGPDYFGIPVLSDRMVFVLDVSGSMDFSIGDTSKTPTRMEHARRELTKVLKAMDEQSRFNIVFFDQKIRVWAEGLPKATKRNKQLAIRAVNGVVARGGTDSYGALELAFKRFRGIDTIYFLSDGVPSVGKSIVQERILERVWRWNRLRGVRVHTVALLVGDPLNPFRRNDENKPEAARFMRILAEETGGTFMDVR